MRGTIPRKMKKKRKSTRKTRVLLVRAKTEKLPDLAKARAVISNSTGRVQIIDENGHPLPFLDADISLGYERVSTSRMKVIHRVASDPRGFYRDPTTELMRFATLMGVDTNTREIDGERISVTAVVVARGVHYLPNKTPPTWTAEFSDQPAHVWLNTNISPEVVGWVNSIGGALRSNLPQPVGVIVDSELDRLPRINSREEPMVGEVYRPDGYEFVYASPHHSASEHVGNAIMAICDKRASAVLKELASNLDARGWLRGGDPHQWMTAWRMWPREWVSWRKRSSAA